MQEDNSKGDLNKSGSLEIGADIGPSPHLIPKTDNLRQTKYIQGFSHFLFLISIGIRVKVAAMIMGDEVE